MPIQPLSPRAPPAAPHIQPHCWWCPAAARGSPETEQRQKSLAVRSHSRRGRGCPAKHHQTSAGVGGVGAVVWGVEWGAGLCASHRCSTHSFSAGERPLASSRSCQRSCCRKVQALTTRIVCAPALRVPQPGPWCVPWEGVAAASSSWRRFTPLVLPAVWADTHAAMAAAPCWQHDLHASCSAAACAAAISPAANARLGKSAAPSRTCKHTVPAAMQHAAAAPLYAHLRSHPAAVQHTCRCAAAALPLLAPCSVGRVLCIARRARER